MKIGIIAALDSEFVQIRSLLGGRTEGIVGGNEIIIRKSGIGKVNAALCAAEFIGEYPLDCIVNTGVAGGLDPSLKCFDMVAAREVVYHDVWCGAGNAYGQVQGLPERFRSNDTLYAKAMEAGAKGGLLCSGDFFISTSAQAEGVLAHFPGGLAVDMESGAISQVCCMRGVPFLCLRIISDAAGGDHQCEYDNFWAALADGSFAAVRRFLEILPSSL